MGQSEQLLDAGNQTRATQLLRSALLLRPSSAQAHTLLGNIDLNAGRARSALVRFRSAVLSEPRYANAYIGLAQAHSQLGNTQSAIEAYRHYLALRPSGPYAPLARREVGQLASHVVGAVGPNPAPMGR
jgi:Tfp pilus assembly protein PilF